MAERATRSRMIPLAGLGTNGTRRRRIHLAVGWMTFCALASSLAGAGPAAAAEPGTPGDWRFTLSPYLWIAGLDGKVATLPGLPTVDVDASFEDIIESSDVALMFDLEVRYRRLGFLADISYLDLSGDAPTPGPAFGGVDLDFSTFFATLGPFYRAVDLERGTLDVFAGARIWRIESRLKFEPGLLPSRRSSDDEAWADPVLGARGSLRVYGSIFVSGAFDVGGFEAASDLTWQVLGTIDLRPLEWLTLRAGYRHLEVDYENGGFRWDVALSGPILGATLSL